MASAALPREEVLPATLSLARDIATYCAPVATGVTKQLVNRSLEEPDRTSVCRVETQLTMWAGTLRDTGPGVTAFRTGSEPSFTCSKHERAPAEIDPMLVVGRPSHRDRWASLRLRQAQDLVHSEGRRPRRTPAPTSRSSGG